MGSVGAAATGAVNNSRPRMALHAGALVATVALTVFVAFHKAPLAGDRWLARSMNGWDWARPVAGAVNELGRWHWAIIVAAILLASVTAAARPRRRTVRAVVTLTLVLPLLLVNSVLKDLVDSPRPGPGNGIAPDHLYDSGGFPSGHTTGAVLVFGSIAVVAGLVLPSRPRWIGLTLGAGLIVLAGPARVITGAHWPSDVVGGYLWGAVLLVIAVEGGRLAGHKCDTSGT